MIREGAKIVKESVLSLREFDEQKFNPKNVYESDQMRVIVAYFKEGQFIPVHTPGVDVVLCILDGKAEVVAGEETIMAEENDLIVVPKGVKRGVRALTELTILHVVQPPPSQEDHQEVHQKLASGQFD